MTKEYSNNIPVIYKITSKKNGNFYIGSTVKCFKRKREHFRMLFKNKHHSVHLQNHVNKYGIEDLEFSVIEMIMFKEDLLKREQYWIDTLKPKFNISKITGGNFNKGVKQSKEWIQKRIDARGENGTLKPTPEALKNQSISHKGQVCPMKGKHHSNKSKIKMGLSQKKRFEKEPVWNKGKFRKVIDLSNGKIYNSSKELSEITGIPKSTLIKKLNGNATNNTNFKYYIN